MSAHEYMIVWFTFVLIVVYVAEGANTFGVITDDPLYLLFGCIGSFLFVFFLCLSSDKHIINFNQDRLCLG